MSCIATSENIFAGNCGVLGGLKVKAYYAFTNDISFFPQPIAPTTFEQAATVTADFVMKPGKYFRRLTGDLEMPMLSGESAGGVNNLSAANKYKFAQAGTSAQLVGLVNAIKNRSIVLIVEDLAGNKRIIGSEGLPAKLESFSENTGAKVADAKVLEFTVYAPGDLALFYTGVVPLPPENIVVDELGEAITDEVPDFIIY